MTFIGYSLPADDINVKCMLKRALIAAAGPRPNVVVMEKGHNPNVENNYRQFFGDVTYRREGFERFVAGL